MRVRDRRLLKLLIPAAVAPLLLLAFPLGSPPGHTGAPGEPTCWELGCHNTPTSTLYNNSSAITLTFPGERQYTPGVAQHLRLTVFDTDGFSYGFQLSARDPQNRQAGDLRAIGDEIVVAQNGVQYLGHTKPLPALAADFDWTPPASDVGPVTFYIAADASNNDGGRGGDHIHVRAISVPPVGSQPPVITSVTNGATPNSNNAGFAPNTFVTVKGTNLVSATQDWTNFFVDGVAPTTLSGARVLVNGRPAFISYTGRAVVPDTDEDQINFITADTSDRGTVDVRVETAIGLSNPLLIQLTDRAPAFFLWNNRYITALQSDFSSYVGPTDLFGGAPLALPIGPAAANDTVRLYGTGFGDTTPAVAAGHIPNGTEQTTENVRVFFDQTEAEVLYHGMSPFVGVYEMIVRVPNLAAGDHEVRAQIGSSMTPQGAFVAIQ